MSEDPITLRFDSFRGFLEECSDRISEQGIFLATEEIRPIGSTIEFQIGIDSDFPLLRGTGEVVWVVEPNGGGDAPGMAVRYRSTDDATMTLARRIAERQREKSGSAFDLERVAADEPPPASARGEGSEDESGTGEPGPSLATQAVDALIENPVRPEAEESETVEAPAAAPEPEAAPEPALAAAAAPPEASYEPTEEMDAVPKRGRGGLWAALVLIAALAGAAYWQRDLLLAKLGGSADREAAAPAAEPELVEPPIQAPAEPVIQAPTEPAIEAPEEPEGESEIPSPADAAPIPEPTGPLTRIEDVRWEASVGVTLLELVADGAFAADGYSLERLEDPPRLLLKIAGVTAPLPTPTLAVGSEEVVGVRTGLHGAPPETSLHVVVDLADPTAQVTVAEVRGAVLQLRVASSAISP